MTESLENLIGRQGFLAGPNQEILASQELKFRKQAEEELAAQDRLDEIKSAASELNTDQSLDVSLRREITETRFDGESYFAVLFLSLIKDLLDLASLGIGGTFINIAISIAFFTIFAGRRAKLKRLLMKKYIWPMIIEFIPFLNILPIYSLSTVLFKNKIDNKVSQLKNSLNRAE